MGDLGSYKRAEQARRALLNRGARHWLDDGTEDAAVAQHEAGHALVARLLGFNVTALTVEPDSDFGGKIVFGKSSHHRAFDGITVLVAGSESEKLFGSSDNGHKNDLAHARALGDSGTIKQARRAARSMLKANFVALASLSVALLDKRMLFRGEIDAIIAAAGQGDDDGDDNSDEPGGVYGNMSTRAPGRDFDDDDDDDDDRSMSLAEFIEHKHEQAFGTGQRAAQLADCFKRISIQRGDRLVFYGERP